MDDDIEIIREDNPDHFFFEERSQRPRPIKKPKAIGTVQLDKTRKMPSKDINDLIEFFRREMSVEYLDGSSTKNRHYAYILLQKYKSVEAVKGIITAASNDQFHSRNATSFMYLFYNAEKILKNRRPETLAPEVNVIAQKREAAIRACGKCKNGMVERPDRSMAYCNCVRPFIKQ